MDMSSKECEVCNKWRQNQRHQEVQCVIEDKIYLSGRSSGIVEVSIFFYSSRFEKSNF